MRGRWLTLNVVNVDCVAAAAVALLVAGCRRGAEEPPSAARDVATSAVTASVATAGIAINDAGRCVVPTSDAPPPAVLPAAHCPPDPGPRTLEAVTVRFPDAREGAVSLRAELARRPQDNERGLMYRTSMDAEHGMLFDLGDRKLQTFWMRNTCIPLDMLFLDDDGLVVGILENVPTLNDAPRGVPCPSTHVLEVNAGWSRRHGVRAGQRAILPGA